MSSFTKVLISSSALLAVVLPAAAFAQSTNSPLPISPPSVSALERAGISVGSGTSTMVHRTPMTGHSAPAMGSAMPQIAVPAVSMGLNGSVNVRGAKVESVSGQTITAESTWGSAVLNWNIVEGPSTKTTGSTTLSSIQPGDTLAFSGSLNQSDAGLTVNATMIHDGVLPTPTPMTMRPMMEGSTSASGQVDVQAGGPATPVHQGFFASMVAHLGL